MRPVRLFSKRHERAILERRLSLTIPKRLRRRLWFILERFNHYYEKCDDTGWFEKTDSLAEVEIELKYRYGVERLEAYRDDDSRGSVNLKDFVVGCYPSQVFDVVELFYLQAVEDRRLALQGEINSAMEDEDSPWRLCDGQFFQVDADFIELHLIASSYELIKAEGYEGALDEFNEARNDLSAGDYKGAIVNSCKSFESVLKAVTNTQSGNASVLIRALPNTGFFSGMPNGFGPAFGDTVLMSLPFLRNRLGGHGQGESVQAVPKLFAELAIHLSAALNMYLIKRTLELRPKPPPEEPPMNEDDEIPF